MCKSETYKLTDEMIDKLTKEEIKTFIAIASKFRFLMSRANVLQVPFKDITPNMKPVARSRFKKKLMELQVMNEYDDKLWISPFILDPLDDKNFINFKHYVKQSWNYLFNNVDKKFYDLDNFINKILS